LRTSVCSCLEAGFGEVVGGEGAGAEGGGIGAQPALEQGAEVSLLRICEGAFRCAALGCGLGEEGLAWVWYCGGLGWGTE
jgi:hypothetical protein